jgi:GT2 family glycosyltransferase
LRAFESSTGEGTGGTSPGSAPSAPLPQPSPGVPGEGENPPSPVLSVILVNYNTREMTLKCLGALFDDLVDLPAEVWLVDNASNDGSIAGIRERFPSVKLIENKENAGFGKANNQAMRVAAGRFIMLLNTDAFLNPGAIRAMLGYLEAHPKVGVVGPRLLNADGSLQHSCFRFPTPMRALLENLWISTAFPNHPVLGDYRHWPHDAEREVDWVVGACMLVRREVFERTGGFDETFFMYSEEADWQRRIRGAGWRIAFTPAAVVTHLGGASGAQEKARINRYFFDSLDYYLRKHHGLGGLLVLRLAMTFGCAVRAVLWLGASLLPSRRAVARNKVRLHLWLVKRQSTQWRTRLADER